MNLRHPLTLPLVVNAGLLLAVLCVLGLRLGGESAAAQADRAGPAGGGNLYAVPGQLSQNVYGCWVLDTDRQRLLVYRYVGGRGELSLAAARSLRSDVLLTDYRNAEPTPADVEELLGRQ